MEEINHLEKLISILAEASEMGASDIHIAPMRQVLFRVDGKLKKGAVEEVTEQEIEQWLKELLKAGQADELKENGELDFSYSLLENRIRVNVFKQQGVYAMSVRVLPIACKMPQELGIPQSIVRLAGKNRGLILVTGAAGSGKTTTLASLLQFIAAKDAKTIVTLENPVEYLYESDSSLILQREIGSDSRSYVTGLSAALKEDPDVILVGELEDYETAELAIKAAETGHLVLASVHTGSVLKTIERMIEIFPPHKKQQVRAQMSEVLLGIISQQLLPKQGEKGRVAAYEVMIADANIRNLIRDSKNHQIPSVMRNDAKEGMITMDEAIYNLYMKSSIDSETAIAYAEDAADMRRKVELF